ncbi:MAG TPA: transporter substrate-binding domain-containing protein [Rhabdochlamydiaceae bacterium]|jgi:polar amino acid transport system substrate-binding protein|nr:transporter substrate-binding domain-containing protein [Rhabdochlamydiaceae bacterium]
MRVLFRAIVTLGCLFFFSCGGSKADYDYTVAFDPAWYGLSLSGREADLTAFTTELLMEIGKLEKVNIGVYERSWSNLMYALQEGECDAICSTMQPYLFYEKLYRFSNLYLMTGPVLVIRAKSPAKPLEKLNGDIIGILRESNGVLILEKYPGIIQRTYDSVPKALIDTTKSEIDGTLVDILSAESYTRDLFQGQLKIATPPLTQEGFRVLSLKNHKPEFTRIFDRGLARLKSDGTYAALAKKWRLAEPLEN